ncbi:MAG TPA: MFS transporter, partial [Rhodospirillales bacterium]|nr:MFS transporter [Rhodospirillales bacterium]
MTKRTYLIVICASVVVLLSMGMRQSFGLLQAPIAQSFGIGLSAFSLSIAVQNLVWGLSQPIIGALSDKYGSGRVIAIAA